MQPYTHKNIFKKTTFHICIFFIYIILYDQKIIIKGVVKECRYEPQGVFIHVSAQPELAGRLNSFLIQKIQQKIQQTKIN
jgi:hypothetical protein